MITGKNSALKGFALFAWAVVLILAFIGCCIAGQVVFVAAAIALFGVNVFCIYTLYDMWSGENE